MAYSGCIDGQRWRRRVGKATGSRECAPDDRLRVPTMPISISRLMVGTARARLCPPYEIRFVLASCQQQKTGGTNGQAEGGITTRGAARREEEMVGPQDGR